MARKIILSQWDMGLTEIHREMIKKQKDKVGFWRPIYKQLVKEDAFKGLVPGVTAHTQSRSFKHLIEAFNTGYGHWLAPVGQSYEDAGKIITKAIAKELNVIIEVE